MGNADKNVLIIGCFDTKNEEFNFLYNCIKAHGTSIITINTGTMESTSQFPVDYDSDVVAVEGGSSIQELREKNNRGYAIEVMSQGAARLTTKLLAEGRVMSVIGMGGGGGTYIAISAMQVVPFGIPKVCISTVATRDLSNQVKGKDIVLMPSIVDIAGLNSISRIVIQQAASIISTTPNLQAIEKGEFLGRIAVSMFGNTTKCVDFCKEILLLEGFEVFVFHANGSGGRTMESLIRSGYFDGVLDVTTTELADELFGGVCSAGPDRLTAAAESGIPQVVVPGCMDMINFRQPESVPSKFKGRLLYNWAPDVTLVRTNEEENKKLGRLLASKVNASKAFTSVVIPTAGLSQIDAKGEDFYQPFTNQVLFEEIRKNVKKEIKVIDIQAHINEKEFSIYLVKELLACINDFKSLTSS